MLILRNYFPSLSLCCSTTILNSDNIFALLYLSFISCIALPSSSSNVRMSSIQDNDWKFLMNECMKDTSKVINYDRVVEIVTRNKGNGKVLDRKEKVNSSWQSLITA